MLFFFVGPNCNPCKGLQPEFDQWQTEFGDKFNLIFISSGKAKDNIEKFGDQRTMLLQKDFEVGKLINAMWTPTAVLINSDGTIGSRLAASDDEVRQLIEQLRGEIEKGEPYFVKNSENIRQSEAKLGEEIPQFSLEAINGKTLTSKDLQGKKTLVAFWSTSCGWCDLMMEELRDWDKMKGVDEPNLLLFSNGETDKNLEFDFASPILLDEKDEITKQFGKNGTPSAVLINEDGKIISETAVGANQIWALLGKSKK
jgi:thiol-disulfide isomerase/thioredoxin